MYINCSFQHAKLLEADVFDELESTPMTLYFETTQGHGSRCGVCFHLENKPLALALVKAINDTLATFKDGPPADLIEQPDLQTPAPPAAPDDDMPF
jgi:hypothetical protein